MKIWKVYTRGQGASKLLVTYSSISGSIHDTSSYPLKADLWAALETPGLKVLDKLQPCHFP